MKLDELEIGDGGARTERHRNSLADRAGRVRRATPQRGIAACRKDDGTRADRPRIRHEPDALSFRHRELEGALALADVDARVCEHCTGEHLRDRASRLRTVDAVDAAPRMSALEAELVV